MARNYEYKVAGVMQASKVGIIGDIDDALRALTGAGEWRLSHPIIGGGGYTVGLILEREIEPVENLTVSVSTVTNLADALENSLKESSATEQVLMDTITELRTALLNVDSKIAQMRQGAGVYGRERIAMEAHAIIHKALAPKDEAPKPKPEPETLETKIGRIWAEYEGSNFRDPARALSEIQQVMMSRG